MDASHIPMEAKYEEWMLRDGVVEDLVKGFMSILNDIRLMKNNT